MALRLPSDLVSLVECRSKVGSLGDAAKLQNIHTMSIHITYLHRFRVFFYDISGKFRECRRRQDEGLAVENSLMARLLFVIKFH